MDGLGLLRAANVSVWVEACRAQGGAPDPGMIGGARLAPPTAASHAAEIAHLASVGLRDPETAYLTMLAADAQRAANRPRPGYDETGGVGRPRGAPVTPGRRLGRVDDRRARREGATGAELRRAIEEQAAFAHQAALGRDRLTGLHRPRGVVTSASPAEACR